jgi:ribosomal protein S27E
MKKRKFQLNTFKCRCPKCKSVQYLQYLLISTTIQCRKCGTPFVPVPSGSNGKTVRPTVHKKVRVLSNNSDENLSSRADTFQHSEAPILNNRVEQRRKWPIIAAVALLAAAVMIVAGLGFIHVITGSSLSAPHFVLKGSFGYSETFINIDKITGMPWVFAKLKYPIGCKVLQESGRIESDEAFQQRIKGNYENNTLAKSFDQR